VSRWGRRDCKPVRGALGKDDGLFHGVKVGEVERTACTVNYSNGAFDGASAFTVLDGSTIA